MPRRNTWLLKFALPEKLMKLSMSWLHRHQDAILSITQFAPLVFPQRKKKSCGDLCHRRKRTHFPLKGYSNMECVDLHKKKPGSRERAGRESILKKNNNKYLLSKSSSGFPRFRLVLEHSDSHPWYPHHMRSSCLRQQVLHKGTKCLLANYVDFVHMEAPKYVIF